VIVYRKTTLRVSGEALTNNAVLIRRHLAGKARMMAVVKGTPTTYNKVGGRSTGQRGGGGRGSNRRDAGAVG